MDDKELRLECLKLAVSYGSVNTIKDPVGLAKSYLEWIHEKESTKVNKSGDKANKTK
tara:strand:+ start:1744 stop:1914 length:171 start_codon:yes stop_codon:yes gene_type:complete